LWFACKKMPNLKDKFQYGDIIAFKPRHGWKSQAISLIDGSPYSHVGFFWKYENGIPLFLESHEDRGGVVINQLKEWANFDVFRTERFSPRPEEEMLELVGTKYDKSLLWWIFKAKVLKFDLQNNGESELICSEFVDHGYYYALGGGYVCTPARINHLYRTGLLYKVN